MILRIYINLPEGNLKYFPKISPIPHMVSVLSSNGSKRPLLSGVTLWKRLSATAPIALLQGFVKALQADVIMSSGGLYYRGLDYPTYWEL